MLKATVALTKLCPEKIIPQVPALVDRFMRECRRGKASAAYARESVTQLGNLLDAVPSVDAFGQVEGMLKDDFVGAVAIAKAGVDTGGNAKEDPGNGCEHKKDEAAAAAAASSSLSSSSSSEPKTDPAMRARAIECLGCAWPGPQAGAAGKATQERTIDAMSSLLAESVSASVWRVRVAIAAAAGKMLTKALPEACTKDHMLRLLSVLRVAADDIKFHQVRESGSVACLGLVKRAAADPAVAKMCTEDADVLGKLRGLIRQMRNDSDPSTAQKAAAAQLALEKFLD